MSTRGCEGQGSTPQVSPSPAPSVAAPPPPVSCGDLEGRSYAPARPCSLPAARDAARAALARGESGPCPALRAGGSDKPRGGGAPPAGDSGAHGQRLRQPTLLSLGLTSSTARRAKASPVTPSPTPQPAKGMQPRGWKRYQNRLHRVQSKVAAQQPRQMAVEGRWRMARAQRCARGWGGGYWAGPQRGKTLQGDASPGPEEANEMSQNCDSPATGQDAEVECSPSLRTNTFVAACWTRGCQ